MIKKAMKSNKIRYSDFMAQNGEFLFMRISLTILNDFPI